MKSLMLAALMVVPLSTGPAAPASPPVAPVADAAMQQNVDAVRHLLAGGADVNAAQGDGMTALHWAAHHGNLELANVVLKAGAAVTATTRLGAYTPLHLASQRGHGPVTGALIRAGSQVDAWTETGVLPIHLASASGDVETIEVLLSHGAGVNAREGQWGQTPLMFAAAGNRLRAVQALITHGADPALSATVVDIAAREVEDRAAEQARTRRIEAERRGETPPAETREGGGSRESDVQTPEQRLSGSTEVDPLSYADLVGTQGGLTALLLAARDGHAEVATALLDAGADINQLSPADSTSPILMATINGHFDLAKLMFERGADPTLASVAGATPLYAVINREWAPKSRHPQPTDYLQQQISYLELMEVFLKAGVDPNVRLNKQLWFTSYNSDYLQVDRAGATPFWRAAYALDVPAMRMLVSYGADPTTPTRQMPQRSFGRRGGARPDLSGLPPVPTGGPGVYPIHAASGAGYGQGYAANNHNHVPDAWVDAVRYLVEEHGADVNARDLNGYSPVHHAAARGDNDLINYLVQKGADVTLVARNGQTTVDMANGPVQRTQPYPATIALLESLGAVNNHNCVSCE